MTAGAACVLCDRAGGHLLAHNASLRVIRSPEPGFPLFYRVVWQRHVAEFSDLTPLERQICMEAVACVERALRDHLPAAQKPDKINLAAFGNMVPHLHWHVIARHAWDSHFPASFWAAPARAVPPERLAALEAARPDLEAAMVRALAALDLSPATQEA